MQAPSFQPLREWGSRSEKTRMGRIVLIRHGQASFGAEDYDVLSDIGQAQSSAIGRFVAARARSFDRIQAGPRRRQRDTAELMAAAAAKDGFSLPAIETAAALDEFPAFELGSHCLPTLMTTDPEIGEALSGTGLALGSPGFSKALVRLYRLWAMGEVDTGELETFAAFKKRAGDHLFALGDEMASGDVVVQVTSGGVIAVAILLCLGAPDARFVDVAWNTRNASITELRCRPGELTLLSFNGTDHLDDELVTFR